MRPGLPVTSNSYFHSGNSKVAAELNGKMVTVHDFWKWAFSIVNENTIRGILAQYIVALAIGADRCSYDSWRPYDLRISNGRRLEVKTAARAQIWEHGEENRKPKFEVTEKAYYTHETGLDLNNIDFHADIYVLCHYKHPDSNTMDAINLSHWEFWVFTKKQLLENFEVMIKNRSSKKRRQVRVYVSDLQKERYPVVDAWKLKDTIFSL